MTATISLMHRANPSAKQDFSHVPATRVLPSGGAAPVQVPGKAAAALRGSSASRSVQGKTIQMKATGILATNALFNHTQETTKG